MVRPRLAHGASCGRRLRPAHLGLRPAVFVGRPASRLVRVRGDLLGAPVCVLRHAVGRHLAFGLRLLRRRREGRRRRVREVGHGRPGHLVLCVLPGVDVEMDRGLAGRHVLGAGDRDGRFGDEVAGGLEEDLRAARVELRGAFRGVVQGYDLWTGEVVPSFEALGKLDRETALVVDESVGAPFVRVGVVAVVHELEPPVAGALFGDGRGHLLQVHGAGPVVRAVEGHLGRVVGPGTHLEGQGRAILHRGHIVYACVVDVTCHIIAGVVRHGEGGGVGIHAHAEDGTVALGDAIDVEDGPGGVGEDSGRREGGEEEGLEGGLHGEWT